jgi:hypothetical protein
MCVCVCMYIYIYVCISVFLYIYIYNTYTYTYTVILERYATTYTCRYLYTYVCVYMYIWIFIYVNLRTYIWMHACAYIPIHIWVGCQGDVITSFYTLLSSSSHSLPLSSSLVSRVLRKVLGKKTDRVCLGIFLCSVISSSENLSCKFVRGNFCHGFWPSFSVAVRLSGSL